MVKTEKTLVLPSAGLVLIHREEIEEKRGRVFVTQDAQKKAAHLFIGKAVAVGPPRTLESGQALPMPCSPGDRVLYGAFAGWDLGQTPGLADQDEMWLVKGEDIAAVLR